MASPVPKHLIDVNDARSRIDKHLLDHVVDLSIPKKAHVHPMARRHPAKFAPGLALKLAELANTDDIGDPMAGTGTLAYETLLPIPVNDLDIRMTDFLEPLKNWGCITSYECATKGIPWLCHTAIFSPPYYPRTDRRIPARHYDKRFGGIVGFRDTYGLVDKPTGFIGEPCGVDGITQYRTQMTKVYTHLTSVCERMIVVTKNWMRLGVELRLDWDTIIMADNSGWRCIERHGFSVNNSLWARYNKTRGDKQNTLGMVECEDILMFEKHNRENIKE